MTEDAGRPAAAGHGGAQLQLRADRPAGNQQDLTQRIATEQQQLERSAKLMGAATVPPPLSALNERLVRALRAFSRDFGGAREPAARGDFPQAVAAMTDEPAVNRILAAATSIQRACQP